MTFLTHVCTQNPLNLGHKNGICWITVPLSRFLIHFKKRKKNVLTFPKNKLFRRNFSSFLLPGLYSSTYIGNGKYYFKGKLLGEKNKVNEKKTRWVIVFQINYNIILNHILSIYKKLLENKQKNLLIFRLPWETSLW